MFHINILIFTIFWIALTFIQRFKYGIWNLGYALLIGGSVFLYQQVKLWGYIFIFAGIGCYIWFVIILKKEYDKYKYKK